MIGPLFLALTPNALLVIVSLVVAAIASAFFFEGNNSFKDKGLFLATLSILFSFCAMTFSGFGLVGVVVVNIAFYLVLLGIKARRKGPRS